MPDYGPWILAALVLGSLAIVGALLFMARVVARRGRFAAGADELAGAARSDRDLAARVLAEAQTDRDQARVAREDALADRHEAAHIHAAAQAELARVADLDPAAARAELEGQLLAQAERASAARIHRIEQEAIRTAEQRARAILATSLQRLAGPSSAELLSERVELPSEEMKGRIIGKEGRNIRSFEAITGVNLLIDASLHAVTLSSFDAERREVARLTLAQLIADGRIHPGRIEQVYAEVAADAPTRHRAAGHAAAQAAGVTDLHPDLIEVIGRLRLRTSYGQNVMAHLVECAQLAAFMAAEIGADVELARRAAFLHDIGKAAGTGTGTHAASGAALARRSGEAQAVVNAIAAHHQEVEPTSVEAVLVQAADAASAARPGARREELDQFIERVDTLEKLVAAHPGVRQVYAMSAGRDVRVIVEPDLVSDNDLSALARTIADHIQRELTYPGEITVTTVRESRARALTN